MGVLPLAVQSLIPAVGVIVNVLQAPVVMDATTNHQVPRAQVVENKTVNAIAVEIVLMQVVTPTVLVVNAALILYVA